jgi:hypothetical protein
MFILILLTSSLTLGCQRVTHAPVRTRATTPVAALLGWPPRKDKPMTKTRSLIVSCLIIFAGVASISGRLAAAPGDAGVTPGEFIIDRPTLINLGFEWHIDGDGNRNAAVDVSFRKSGDSTWRKGMPLARIQNERIYWPNVFNLVSPNMFAGSILDLEPDTAYEARFVLTDPDGVGGPAANSTRTVTVRTRPEPKPATDGKVYHVYPTKWQGAKIEPAFEGIMCAYNYYCGAGDTAPGGRPRVKPGDTILVHAGTYAYHYEFYGNQTTVNATTTFEGTYYLTADGTPERPIVIKAAGDGEVVLDGRGNFNLFNVKAADYNYFEGITFRNTSSAIWAGTQFIAGAKGLTVKRCRFEDVGMGVFTNYSGSNDFYIADSVFLGRNDPKHLIGWNGQFWQQFENVEGQEYPPVMKSYTAVRLYGSGHVVAYNYVSDFHDGIDTEMYGNPDGSHAVEGPTYPPRDKWDLRPTAIDFYNNYMTNFHDNAFEVDGSMHNIRVMRNLMLNSASHPISTQPGAGGPIYWIRNIAYHAPGGSTRLTNGSAGVFYYNNTILTETSAGSSSNVHWRNNLMLPENAAPAIFNVNTNTNYSSSDYNGFGLKRGVEPAFQWNSPPWNVAAVDVNPTNNPPLVPRKFATLEEYARETKQDQHSVILDYDVFVNVPRLDAKDLLRVQKLYKSTDADFRLRPGSAAVDRGVAIPNVTDGYSGGAPDLGALEVGQTLPIYGPRPQ